MYEKISSIIHVTRMHVNMVQTKKCKIFMQNVYIMFKFKNLIQNSLQVN